MIVYVSTEELPSCLERERKVDLYNHIQFYQECQLGDIITNIYLHSLKREMPVKIQLIWRLNADWLLCNLFIIITLIKLWRKTFTTVCVICFLFFYLLNDSTQFRKLFNYHYFKFVYTIIIYFLLKCLRIYYVENNRSKAVYSLKQIIVFFILAHKDLVNIRYPIYIVISFMEQGLRMKTCLTFFFIFIPCLDLDLD